MIKTALIGAVLSLAAGGGFGYYMAAPYIAANAPAEWSWLLVPAGSFIAGAVVFGIGWFLTVLASQAVMFRGSGI
jgi:hypothetical protein